MDESWAARILREGAVALAYGSHYDSAPSADLVAYLKPAWGAAVSLLIELGAGPPAYLHMRCKPRPNEVVDVVRWIDLGPPSDDDLAEIQRELERSQGRFVWDD